MSSKDGKNPKKMKFLTKTGEIIEGRPQSEISPACIIFSLLDEKGREFNLTCRLTKTRFSETEVQKELDRIIITFHKWITKKLILHEDIA